MSLTDAAKPAALPGARIDEVAPDFEARSTQGIVRMSDFRGRWLVFFSHPADFTPVCTSEFLAFQSAAAQFDALDTDLLGLSIDSVYAHIAWIKDIETRFSTRVTFPIIEDISMTVARLYGMIHDASATTAAVRSESCSGSTVPEVRARWIEFISSSAMTIVSWFGIPSARMPSRANGKSDGVRIAACP